MAWQDIKISWQKGELKSASRETLADHLEHLNTNIYTGDPNVDLCREWLKRRIADLDAAQQTRETRRFHTESLDHTSNLHLESTDQAAEFHEKETAQSDRQHKESMTETGRSICISFWSLVFAALAFGTSVVAWLFPRSSSPSSPTPAAPAQTPPSPAAQPGPPVATPTNAALSDARPAKPPEAGPAAATNAVADRPRE